MTDTSAPVVRPSWLIYWPALVLIVLCVGIEVVLTAADYGVLGQTTWRQRAYEYAGFWPGLLDNWPPNYTAQAQAMFVTYSFLHGGLAHLLLNMITLWSLGGVVIRRVGALGFWVIYIAAILGGALGFGLLSESYIPMVGASGALFGLAGAVLAWDYVDRYTRRVGLWPVAQAALGLFALNLVLWWAMNGHLAWETHLGGFIAGWVVALLVDPRGKQAERSSDRSQR